MADNQKINCTIKTCEYNNCENNKCTLKEINVTDVNNAKVVKADESMCCSYKYNN